MKYLLDTHAAVWLLSNEKKLGKHARLTLQSADRDTLAIADVTLFEVAQLNAHGKLSLEGTPTRAITDLAAHFIVLPIEAAIAADAADLPLPQGDPFDRLIVATARHHRLTLVTKDDNIADSGLVPTLW